MTKNAFAILSLGLMLGGCQAGPSSQRPSSLATSVSASPAAQPAGSAASAPAPAPEQDTHDQDPEEQRMLSLINHHRADYGAAPLRIHATLIRTARWLSQDMAAKSYLSHTDSLGRDSFGRMDDYGYEPKSGSRGENIACGNGDADATFSQWLHSPGHNANMLGFRYSRIGIARAFNPEAKYGWYWTTDFGSE